MTYLRTALGPSSRAPRGVAGGAFGDVELGGPVAVLVAQVNRFGPEAPTAYQFTQAPFPIADVLTPDVALTALTIYLRRSTDAYASIPDIGTRLAIEAANAGFSDPVAFVTAHLAEITQVIAGFADSLGLSGGSLSASNPTALMLALGGLAVWWWLEQRDPHLRRRGGR
jgi:hypothetical protein